MTASRSLLMLAAFVSILGLAPGAFAQPGGEAPKEAPGSALWSVGAGVGMPSFADNIRELAIMLEVPVALVAASRRPELQLLFERKAGEKVHLMFQVSGDYARHVDEDPVDATFRDRRTISGTVIGATGGLRYTPNPGGIVELSVYGVGAISYAKVTDEREILSGDGTGHEETATGMTFGAGLGFALDRELLEGLFLRFSTLVLKATYTTGSGEVFDLDGDSLGHGDTTRLIAGLELKPSIQLRMTF